MKRKPKLIASVQEISRIWTLERPTVLAAALAYFGMFAFAPIIYVSLMIAGFFVDQLALTNQMLETLTAYLGPEITAFIQETVASLTSFEFRFPGPRYHHQPHCHNLCCLGIVLSASVFPQRDLEDPSP